MEYDWRSRFHLPLSEVGRSVGWGEAMRLVLVLLRDPSSETCAAVVSVLETTTEKDDAPVEDFAQRGGRLGNAGDRSPEEVREMLRALGHRV